MFFLVVGALKQMLLNINYYKNKNTNFNSLTSRMTVTICVRVCLSGVIREIR